MSMKCYYCNTTVSEDEHRDVQSTMDKLLGEPCDNEIHISIAENTFVHLAGARPGMTDVDDVLVICARDFVREVASS